MNGFLFIALVLIGFAVIIGGIYTITCITVFVSKKTQSSELSLLVLIICIFAFIAMFCLGTLAIYEHLTPTEPNEPNTSIETTVSEKITESTIDESNLVPVYDSDGEVIGYIQNPND